MKQKPTTHDYTIRTWGHDRIIEPIGADKMTAFITGWGPIDGPKIKKGDFLLFGDIGDKNSLRAYRVDAISYYDDPPDMWNGKAHFVSPESKEITEVDKTIAAAAFQRISK